MDAFRHRLDFALVLARFDSEVIEMNSWIDEKNISLHNSQAHLHDRLSLEDKMTHWKKHQALEIELAANAPRIESLEFQLEELKNILNVSQNNTLKASLAVVDRGMKMLEQWNQLNNTTRVLNATLKEAKDQFDFDQKADRILHWIGDRQCVLNAKEMGKDYEHAKALLNSLTGKDADQSVDATTIKEVNKLGSKLMASGRDSQFQIQSKLDQINEAYAI